MCFRLPKRMGGYFVIPDADFIDMRQKIAHSQWDAENTLGGKIYTVCTALTQIFECTIDKAYRTGATKMVQSGFGSIAPK